MSKTKRGMIASALKEAFKDISQTNGYNTNIYENVLKRFIFPDDNPDLPLITLSAGPEQIVYQPGNFQDRYLSVGVRAYISSEDDTITSLEKLIQDIEKVVENNSRLLLEDMTTIRDLRVTSIDTDQGVLAPLGVAEIQLIVEY